ncbi:uncharacterized protein N7473_004340 [Penicillium subrubescens]|uniref:uncharacterized protein n=1 Tax=Penicillium subrubescens TaxID=1316194 RepID=UPI0025450C97|nr:uncharacterized protein N7473_004340 [Penicillium subrubescens]KAJ5900270.1 hypothetical protein N7473_004340 [Penicillium subrubescens]
MFEDVSFPSPSSPSSRPTHLTVDGDDRLMGDCNSMLISPLSSRSRFTNCRSQQQPLASIPFPYEPKRLSISTLTQRLHEHTLQAPSGGETSDQGRPRHDRAWLSSQYFDDVLTPPDVGHDENRHCHPSLSPCSNSSPTTIPLEFPSLDRPDCPNLTIIRPDHFRIRMERQHISHIQCIEGDIDSICRNILADDSFYPDGLREDDYHPSSLPPRSSPRQSPATLHRSRFGPPDSLANQRHRRRRSSPGTMKSHRIGKSHYTSFAGRRDASKRADSGIRRKSTASAAVAGRP